MRYEWWLQPAGLQPREVDYPEEGVGLHFYGSAPLASQPITGIFSQQLKVGVEEKKVYHQRKGHRRKRKRFTSCRTILQSDLASPENLLEYSSCPSFTICSMSPRMSFLLGCTKAGWPSIISKIRQPRDHQSGLKVYASFPTTSGATGTGHAETRKEASPTRGSCVLRQGCAYGAYCGKWKKRSFCKLDSKARAEEQ